MQQFHPPGRDPQKTTAIIIEALARVGKRGLLASGGGALGAVIHHGGAGTTGASRRAGKPTAICPFFGDQPSWGMRIANLGVGPTPLDPKALSVEGIPAAIASMDDPQMHERAAALGAAIRQACRRRNDGAKPLLLNSAGVARNRRVWATRCNC